MEAGRRLLRSVGGGMITRIQSRQYQQQLKTEPQTTPERHQPVMANEVIESLNPESGKTYIDMTFGAGGHTKRILEAAPDCRVITLDRDEVAYGMALELQGKFPEQVIPLLGKFSDLPTLLRAKDIAPSSIDGVLFDFGCSSMQFDEADRGFSISRDGTLDMRMDRNRLPDQPTAADVLARIDEADLAKILKLYGDEKMAKKIARAVVDCRYSLRKIETTRELADLVNSCFTDDHRTDKLGRPAHNATKTFQALRIFVNDELNEINNGIIIAGHFLKMDGRMVTLTFHSLEDTIVKRHLMGNLIGNVANAMPLKYSSHLMIQDKQMVNSLMESDWLQVHKHVVTPESEEVNTNPRSRSAKLRAAIKIR